MNASNNIQTQAIAQLMVDNNLGIPKHMFTHNSYNTYANPHYGQDSQYFRPHGY